MSCPVAVLTLNFCLFNYFFTEDVETASCNWMIVLKVLENSSDLSVLTLSG